MQRAPQDYFRGAKFLIDFCDLCFAQMNDMRKSVVRNRPVLQKSSHTYKIV